MIAYFPDELTIGIPPGFRLSLGQIKSHGFHGNSSVASLSFLLRSALESLGGCSLVGRFDFSLEILDEEFSGLDAKNWYSEVIVDIIEHIT